MATVTNSYCISEGSGKETNHYEISLKGSGIRYKPGDSLGFYPINNIELVKKTIRKIKAKRNDLVEQVDKIVSSDLKKFKAWGELVDYRDNQP